MIPLTGYSDRLSAAPGERIATFCGSLSHNRYDNNVSRILRNVLDRFRGRTA